eukprot:4734362-Lingulodinium_polyedra.AAC.1
MISPGVAGMTVWYPSAAPIAPARYAASRRAASAACMKTSTRKAVQGACPRPAMAAGGSTRRDGC